MADLYVDFDALVRIQEDLAQIEDLLRGACNQMRDLPVEATGHEELRSRLGEFGEEWDYGIGKLGKFSGGCREGLEAIRRTLQDLDTELASLFEGT